MRSSRAALLATAMRAIFLGIRRFSLGQPVRDLGGEPLLGLLHAAIRHRLVHASVGSNLGAVQCHLPEPHQRHYRDGLLAERVVPRSIIGWFVICWGLLCSLIETLHGGD